jgi:peptidoglycan/LPS O-acetylase OafA/YrhL
VPRYLPTLDGVRGVAIVLVMLDHSAPQLAALGLGAAAWGWCGVDLFFVLSGFLITGIILDGRDQPRFFRNFYARRGLRIWPLYALVVAVNAAVCGMANTWIGPAPFWLYFALFLQNLTPGLAGTLYPAWSLAIEEQFYLVWAPVARYLPVAGLATVLGLVLAFGPWARAQMTLTPVNTLFHLDGLAVGSLIALGLRTRAWRQASWTRLAVWAAGAGLAGVVWAAGGHGAWIDSFLALGFGGLVLGAVCAENGRSVYARLLRWRGLRFLGRISYGLYLTHVIVLALLGGVDLYLDRVLPAAAAAALIVAMRFAAAVAVATALWYGFERPILGLKRYFPRLSENR